MSVDDFMFDAKDDHKYSIDVQHKHDQTLADEFAAQVEAFYSLPRPAHERKEIVFSPSGVCKSLRELYYINTNAPQDEEPLVAWRERLARNGTGVHEVTQQDYMEMERRLNKAGIPTKFRFLEAEIKGERSYMVGKYKVKLRGRSDGKIGVLDDDGNVTEVIGWEKKTKDKRKNINKILKDGQPQEEHRQQAVAYFLIFGIRKWIFEYESLQKPDWSDTEPEKPDIKHFYVEVSDEEAKALLIRLAKVVKAIEEGVVPPCEPEKCGFCRYKNQCLKDGGCNPEDIGKTKWGRKKKTKKDDD